MVCFKRGPLGVFGQVIANNNITGKKIQIDFFKEKTLHFSYFLNKQPTMLVLPVKCSQTSMSALKSL